MTYRFSGVVMVMIMAVTGVSAQETPKTPWGAPDLQGVWDFRSITPMQRPEELGDKAFLTVEEVAELEAAEKEKNERLLNRAAERTTASNSVDSRDDGSPGFYNNFWLDNGTSADESRRTSLIVDPPNGRMPALTAAAAQRQQEIARIRRGVLFHAPTPGGWVEDIGPGSLQLRCITGFNAGPPMTPSAYNNNVQLFQTEDHVVLLNEMNHNFRIIPLDGRDEIDLPQWTGDSRGYWEGDTLVVETRNFKRETSFVLGITDAHLNLTERFTRTSQDVLTYEATIDDPTVWQEEWTYQISMKANEFPLYEYACHEGNYGLENILAGARLEEAQAEAAAQGSE